MESNRQKLRKYRRNAKQLLKGETKIIKLPKSYLVMICDGMKVSLEEQFPDEKDKTQKIVENLCQLLMVRFDELNDSKIDGDDKNE